MGRKQVSGSYGESLANAYLRDLGFEILALNWRYRHWEVDVIAMDGDVLVFVEVKSRSNLGFGQPMDFVDAKKQRNLIQAAEAYLECTDYQGEIRFDIVSVYLDSSKIELIKDAFWGN